MGTKQSARGNMPRRQGRGGDPQPPPPRRAGGAGSATLGRNDLSMLLDQEVLADPSPRVKVAILAPISTLEFTNPATYRPPLSLRLAAQPRPSPRLPSDMHVAPFSPPPDVSRVRPQPKRLAAAVQGWGGPQPASSRPPGPRMDEAPAAAPPDGAVGAGGQGGGGGEGRPARERPDVARTEPARSVDALQHLVVEYHSLDRDVPAPRVTALHLLILSSPSVSTLVLFLLPPPPCPFLLPYPILSFSPSFSSPLLPPPLPKLSLDCLCPHPLLTSAFPLFHSPVPETFLLPSRRDCPSVHLIQPRPPHLVEPPLGARPGCPRRRAHPSWHGQGRSKEVPHTSRMPPSVASDENFHKIISPSTRSSPLP